MITWQQCEADYLPWFEVCYFFWPRKFCVNLLMCFSCAMVNVGDVIAGEAHDRFFLVRQINDLPGYDFWCCSLSSPGYLASIQSGAALTTFNSRTQSHDLPSSSGNQNIRVCHCWPCLENVCLHLMVWLPRLAFRVIIPFMLDAVYYFIWSPCISFTRKT